jgi:hypothetical protein
MELWRRLRGRIPSSWRTRTKAWTEALIRRVPALSSLRAKLIIPYVFLTLIIALLGVFIITRLVAGSFQERFGNQLIEAGRVTADGIVRREQEHLENLRLLTFMQGVPEAFLDRDELALRQVFESLAINNKIEVLGAIDDDGLGIVTLVYQEGVDGTETEFYIGEDYTEFAPVNKILAGVADERGDKYAGMLSTSVGALLITTAPVYVGDEEFAGVLFAGSRLDNLITDIKLQALADVILLDTQGEVVATTLVEPDEGFGELLLPPDLIQSLAFNSLLSSMSVSIQYCMLRSKFAVTEQV